MTQPATVRLDIRPLLEQGKEPFSIIMAAVAALRDDQSLQLLAPFEPQPLYAVLRQQGFQSRARHTPDGHWEILVSADTGEPGPSGSRELDLRELPPPLPMQEALDAVAGLGRDESLILHTRFRPVFLLDQLEETGFDGESEELGADHWKTHIWRIAT